MCDKYWSILYIQYILFSLLYKTLKNFYVKEGPGFFFNIFQKGDLESYLPVCIVNIINELVIIQFVSSSLMSYIHGKSLLSVSFCKEAFIVPIFQNKNSTTTSWSHEYGPLYDNDWPTWLHFCFKAETRNKQVNTLGPVKNIMIYSLRPWKKKRSG